MSTFGCMDPSGTSVVATRIGTACSITGALSAAASVSGALPRRRDCGSAVNSVRWRTVTPRSRRSATLISWRLPSRSEACTWKPMA